MASFARALAIVLKHEGGYVNDPVDRGGETYRGIARRFHPDWSGWKRIDALKRRAGFPASLGNDRSLQRSVADFYRRYYWRPIQGDKLGDEALAQELFDTAVNMGVRRAVRFFQEALNLLNRNQKNYDDLVVDGWLGAKSLAALEALVKSDRGSRHLLKLMNALQAAHYIEIMRNDPRQERFARGWLNRT
ncbi:MAG: glycosyl hydrolase 108 family protein [Gammaproteobacteria bacterium]